MSEELKACWMCGSPAIKYWEGDSNCACGNKDCYLYMDFMPIERWNKRFIEDALRTELDACKSVLADAETQRDMNGAEIDTLLKQLDIAINAIKWCIGFFKDSDHEFDEITKVLLTAHAKIDCIGD